MWLLIKNDNLFLMDSKGAVKDKVDIDNNKLTIPKKWISKDTNLIINHDHNFNKLKALTKSNYSFDKLKLAEFAKNEALKRLTWGIDREAYKYTNIFKSVFGYNKRFPWCAAFVTYCLRESGLNVPIYCNHYKPYTYALCESYQKFGQANGFYIENNIYNKPEVGDIILFDWNHRYNQVDTDWEDHIGVCIEIVSANCIIVAEGNKNNKSGIFRRQLTTIEGYVRLPDTVIVTDF